MLQDAGGQADARAGLRYVKDYPPEDRGYLQSPPAPQYNDMQNQGDYQVYRSNRDPLERSYTGPLSLGNPGVSASLWQESRAGNDLFRDHRAFQPMDLVTVIVAESSEGKREADTEVQHESSILFGIATLFGFEQDIEASNPGINAENLLSGTSTSEFTAEGETSRKGSLKARMSAMVVEVLPSGVLRIEGEKILSVNNEEQVMVLSGLVRQRDISSANEVDSSRIASLRIDYFGRGTVGEAQAGGWISRMMRRFWPF
jgi:flagellar L-ring protein precursor FlgH